MKARVAGDTIWRTASPVENPDAAMLRLHHLRPNTPLGERGGGIGARISHSAPVGELDERRRRFINSESSCWNRPAAYVRFLGGSVKAHRAFGHKCCFSDKAKFP